MCAEYSLDAVYQIIFNFVNLGSRLASACQLVICYVCLKSLLREYWEIFAISSQRIGFVHGMKGAELIVSKFNLYSPTFMFLI